MRRTERRVADERMLGREQPGDRVDARDLERLIGAERGQQPREPAGEHRLAGAGRPGEQQVVPAGRSELERAPGALLAADVGEVGVDGRRDHAVGRRPVRLRFTLAAEIRGRLGEVADGHRLDPGERRLGRRLGRAEQPLQSSPARSLRRREHAADGPDSAVERELADRGVLGEPLGGT